jgi:hypothetical protein
MRQKFFLLLAGIAMAVATGFATPARGSAAFHCDESCGETSGKCEFDQFSFTVCIGGGAWIPCETGACGQQ